MAAVDSTTNRGVPKQPEAIPDGILRRKGAHQSALENIHPGKMVDAAMLWTRNAGLMFIRRNLRAASLLNCLDRPTSSKYESLFSWKEWLEMPVVAVTDETFDAEIRNAGTPVLVDFWAEWCGPCKQIAPALDELSKEFEGRLTVAKVNIDENPNSPVSLGVRGIPALFLFKDGEPISNLVGARSKASLRSWIESTI